MALVSLTSPAFAAHWTVDSTQSSLTFEGSQSNEIFHGGFSRFTSSIDFDEAAPAASHIAVMVDMASATADGKDRNDALPTNDWFASAKFPKAEFVSSNIVKTGEHQFAATGNLTLHGITREVTLPFTLTAEGGMARASGSVVLKRNDYGIGTGQWASDAWIAYPVTVSYSILARTP